jgi:nucleotide-binding universal stress UspA family protein
MGAPFGPIIVPLDETEESARAMDTAVAVGRTFGVPLILLSVRQPAAGSSDLAAELDALAIDADVPVARRDVVEADDVARAIAEAQAAEPGSIVCMATSGRTGMAEVLLGGTAAGVLRRTDGPVLLVGPHARAPQGVGDVQACLDGSERSEAVLPLAAAWVRATHGRLWLVRSAPPIHRSDPAHELAELRAAAARLADEHLVDGLCEVVHGDDVAEALVEHAGALDASLIAMTTHGRTGPAGRLLGSTTLRVVRHARCPVLVRRS